MSAKTDGTGFMDPIQSRASHRPFRVGSVSYLNAKPLIHGLERDPDIDLRLEVPARLLDGLKSRDLDVALLPVIDYQRMTDLKIIPRGGIGSDGPTLTVRIFSPIPIPEIRTLACDPDSHTSVALAKILLAERWNLKPELIELRPPQGDPSHHDRQTAQLLIGDKVVLDEPVDMPFQVDLGAAWKEWTGLPFVFAIWTAPGNIDLRDLPQRLEKARLRGMESLEAIIARHAVPRGWPAPLAMRYLSKNLQFEIGPRQLEAISLFHELAFMHGLLKDKPRPLCLYALDIAQRDFGVMK